jgi:hypothetical protein
VLRLGSKIWLGRTEFLTRTIQGEPRLETRKPTTRAKWRSSMSAYGSVLKTCLTPPTLLEIGILRQCQVRLSLSI